MQVRQLNFFSALLVCAIGVYSFSDTAFSQATTDDNSAPTKLLNLDQCIKIAVQNNRQYKISAYQLQIAEAQYKQALSTYWPQLNGKVAWTQQKDDPFMLYPPSQMVIPPIPIMGTSLALPPIPVPEQSVKLMDRQNLYGALELSYPIYTGGMLAAKRTQAQYGREIARYEAKRTDLQVIYDITRYYYASIFAEQVNQVGQLALDRLEATLQITENLYKEGSGRVKKTDYLKNKTIVESIRALIISMDYNKILAKRALVFSMGLSDTATVEIADSEIPFHPFTVDIRQLMDAAYQFNPDWNKMDAALKVYEAQVKEAKSEYFPKLALFGNLSRIENDYDYGIVSPEMKSNWTVGIGMEIPLFTGFRSLNKVRENKARLEKLKEQKFLFREGLALQVNQVFSQIQNTIERANALKIALDSASENRSLTDRAYQMELVDEMELIQSQISESFMQAQYLKVQFDHLEAQCKLNYLIGTEIYNMLSE
jgi:outer membrane protein